MYVNNIHSYPTDILAEVCNLKKCIGLLQLQNTCSHIYHAMGIQYLSHDASSKPSDVFFGLCTNRELNRGWEEYGDIVRSAAV